VRILAEIKISITLFFIGYKTIKMFMLFSY